MVIDVAALPDPMTPPDCDLRGLEWMPMDVVTIMDATVFTTTTGDEFKAAFALWCKSWRQVPAGSLPNNEKALAELSRARSWKKVREKAMHGWVLCSDDRYYHRVIADKALEALPSRKDFEHKKTAEAERKARERADRSALFALLREHGQVPPYDTKTTQLRELAKPFQTGPDPQPSQPESRAPDTPASVTPPVTSHAPVTARRGTGEGEGHKKKKGAKAPLSADELPPWMQSLVAMYHEVLPELPGVRVMDKDREQALRDFWDWVLTTSRPDGKRRATNADEALSWTRDYFGRARNNDFIMGRGHRAPEHQNWRCSIEYLLSSRGMKKVLEETKAMETA